MQIYNIMFTFAIIFVSYCSLWQYVRMLKTAFEMNDKTIKPNSVKAWLLAARPKTLSGAAVPVMIGTALTYADRSLYDFKAVPAVLCFLFAFIMQIDANFINDCFDFLSGNDDETRLGPKRACAQGWVSVRKMKVAIVITTVLACLAGFPLIIYGGAEMILIGLICVIFCFLYTTHLSYMGMGDLLVLLFFGVVPVCITYYLQTGTVSTEALVTALACGLVIDTLLVVNNYRDIDNDRRAGKRTLIVRLGAAKGRGLYLLLGVAACVMGGFFAFTGHLWAAVLPAVYLVLHVVTFRRMVKIGSGRGLNAVLGDTARNMFVYGVLVSLGLLL